MTTSDWNKNIWQIRFIFKINTNDINKLSIFKSGNFMETAFFKVFPSKIMIINVKKKKKTEIEHKNAFFIGIYF